MPFDIFKIFKSSVVPEPPFDQSDAFARAVFLKDQGRLAEAAAICLGLMQSAPGKLEARVLLAEIEAVRGEPEKAIELYTGVLALEPRHAAAHYKRGNLRKDRAELEQALADYDRATDLDPRHAKAFCNRGVVLARLGRLEPALQSYDRTLALDPVGFTRLFQPGRRAEGIESTPTRPG